MSGQNRSGEPDFKVTSEQTTVAKIIQTVSTTKQCADTFRGLHTLLTHHHTNSPQHADRSLECSILHKK